VGPHACSDLILRIWAHISSLSKILDMRSIISRREHVWAIPSAIYIARWQYHRPRRTERRQHAGMLSHPRILRHRAYTLSSFLQDLIQANENLKAGLLHQQTPTPSPSPSPSPPSPTPSPPGDSVRDAVSGTLNSGRSSVHPNTTSLTLQGVDPPSMRQFHQQLPIPF